MVSGGAVDTRVPTTGTIAHDERPLTRREELLPGRFLDPISIRPSIKFENQQSRRPQRLRCESPRHQNLQQVPCATQRPVGVICHARSPRLIPQVLRIHNRSRPRPTTTTPPTTAPRRRLTSPAPTEPLAAANIRLVVLAGMLSLPLLEQPLLLAQPPLGHLARNGRASLGTLARLGVVTLSRLSRKQLTIPLPIGTLTFPLSLSSHAEIIPKPPVVARFANKPAAFTGPARVERGPLPPGRERPL